MATAQDDWMNSSVGYGNPYGGPTIPLTPSQANNPFYFGQANPSYPNPLYYNGGGGGALSSAFNTNYGGGASGVNGVSSGGFGNLFSNSNIGNNFSGGGTQQFDPNQPAGYNPYQFMPSFQQFQRPDSPVASETPESEAIRQYMMGQLLGPQEGQQTAMDELLKTVGGDYLNPETNPYLTESINALGADTTNQLNKSINDILSRAGVGGALGGSRAALMQGQAAGESARGFNETVANLLNQNYQGERNRQLGSIPTLLTTEQEPTQLAAQAGQLADVPRQYQQQLIDAQMQEWLRQQNERMLPVQVGQSVMGQRMGQTIPIVQQQQSALGGLGSLAQGLGSAAGGLGSLFSGGSSLANALGISNPTNYLSTAQQSLGFDPYASLMGAGGEGIGGLFDLFGSEAGGTLLDALGSGIGAALL